MARRGMAGQLNMFDFFSSVEENSTGEVEMVSLMPSFEDTSEVEKKNKVEEVLVAEEKPVVEKMPVVEKTQVIEKNLTDTEKTKVVMSRSYERDGEQIEIAYLNYNKVRICKNNETPVIHSFASSKEAVDFYVMHMLENEKEDK